MTKEGRVEELQALISLGKKKGYLTYEEINNRLPEDITSPEQIDRILIKLDEMDIEVIDSPLQAPRPDVHPRDGKAAPPLPRGGDRDRKADRGGAARGHRGGLPGRDCRSGGDLLGGASAPGPAPGQRSHRFERFRRDLGAEGEGADCGTDAGPEGAQAGAGKG